ncbi:efflux RND transporter periplasmic adaptor subunit [Desulfosoma sp.]|uniref:efflux RND transporter periplasmic adaptor subunit n=1 Tax=Desulfosoma sp. TaxID=2603217 RepID=UPI00404951DC
MDNKSAQQPKQRISMVVALGVAAALLLLSAFNVVRLRSRPSETRDLDVAVPVAVRSAHLASVEESLKTTGDLVPMRDVYLYPAVPGKRIQQVFFERGQWVSQDALVVRLDDAEVAARLRQARASLQAARVQMALLEKDQRRMENLYREKAVAKQRLDHTRAEYQAAQARVEEAQAALKTLEEIHADFFLRSPIAGMVAERYLDPGNLTDTRKPIVRITDETVLKVVFHVPEKDFGLMRPGMKGFCRLDAFPGRTFEGTVTVLSPVLDPRTRTALAELHLPNPDMALRSGMFAHVTIPLKRRETLVVDRDAVVRLPGTGQPYVFVVEGGKAHLRNVRLGIEQETLVEIVEGLRLNDQVIVRGQNRVVEGSSVEMTDFKAS